jgi:hypothetical protein
MSKDYVTQIDDAYRVSGTRVSLDSVVYAWLDRLSLKWLLKVTPRLLWNRYTGP